jgi:hypothetical protein
MKTSKIKLVAIASFVLAVINGVATAATESWTYTLSETPDAFITFVVADNYGGVAFVWEDDQAVQEGVIWLDRTGTELYRSAAYSSVGGVILGASRRGILYSFENGKNIVAVSRNGTESVITATNPFFMVSYVYVDHFGFFARTGQIGNSITRYNF